MQSYPDAEQYLRVKNTEGTILGNEIHVIFAGSSCAHPQKEAFSIKPGTIIEVHGVGVGDNTVSICGSKDYSIKSLDTSEGIVSFIKTDVGTWPLEWRLNIFPKNTENSEFQIISILENPPPVNAKGFDLNLLGSTLVESKEILPRSGLPVDIKFRLVNSPSINPNGPLGYQYLSLSAGFSRIGGFKNGTIPNPVTPYGSSFPIYMLGNKIDAIMPEQEGSFVDSSILLVTLKTSDDTNSYAYKIFLKKNPAKTEPSKKGEGNTPSLHIYPAKYYWYLEGMGWIKTEKEVDGYKEFLSWTGDRDINGHVKISELSDKEAHLSGYKQALALIIEDRFPIPYLGETSEKELMATLTRITGLSSLSKSEWTAWWSKNQDKIVLSGDEHPLVVLATFMGGPSYDKATEKLRSHLNSHIYYTQEKLPKETCKPIYSMGQLFTGGKWGGGIIDESNIASVEVEGDRITLPVPLIIQTFMEGLVEEPMKIHSTMREDDAVHAKVTLSIHAQRKEQTCIAMTFYPNSMPDRVQAGDTWIRVPTIPKKCSAMLQSIKPGMTRAELEKVLYADGGITSPFHQERYVLKDCAVEKGAVKLNIAFKPPNMTDAMYYLGNWKSLQQSPDDTVVRLSPPYMESPTND